MRRTLIYIVQFSLFSGACYLSLLMGWGLFASPRFSPNLTYPQGARGHLLSRLNEVKHVQDVDILFLGSSHAYRGFDTRIFAREGFSAFNLGSSSQTPIQTQVLLERYLAQLRPKLVVYEVYPVTFSIDGVESALDLIANDRNDRFSAAMALRSRHITVFNAFLYGTMRDIVGCNDGITEATIKDVDTYVPGGYVERKMAYFTAQPVEEQEWPANEQQLRTFQENIAMLRSTGTEFILVKAPVTRSLKAHLTDDLELSKVLTAAGPYFDLNERTHLDDSLHFYDDDHLNQRGVELFNKELLGIIRSRTALGEARTK